MNKYSSNLLAIALAVGLSALGKKTNQEKVGFKLFLFDQTLQGENPALEADAKDVNNYRIVPNDEVLCEGLLPIVCAIWAEENGNTGKPLIAGHPIEGNLHNMFVGAAFSGISRRDE